MIGLSNEIELGINSVIEALNYDISLDKFVRDPKLLKEYKGYSISVNLKDGTKKSGELTHVHKEHISIRQTATKDHIVLNRKIAFGDIKDARVYKKDSESLDADRMKAVIDAKTSSFSMAKQMLHKWVNSPNAPHKDKLRKHIEELVEAGDKALKFLREALAYTIDYDALESHKIKAAVQAKPVILNGIFELDQSINELRVQLEGEDFNLTDKEFKIGYPERFAKGEFYPKSDYHKEWYNAEEDAVMICPKGTKGKIIELYDLKIQLPEVPSDESEILFWDKPKKDQYWRRPVMPDNISPDNVEAFDSVIKEQYRRFREGIWFMNNGEPVYMTGHMYFALTFGVMQDNGSYMDYREAQLKMFYHLEACIRDPRCLGQIFLKSRRTGFTYVILFILLQWSITNRNFNLGMTSKSGRDAQEAFDKLSYAFQALPFWLRPVVKGKEDSPSELFFGKPSNNSKEAKKQRLSNVTDYLNTTINHRPTNNDSYDSVKLNGYLGDESAKWGRPGDYITHFGMIAPTMMPNGTVVGKAFLGSTMGSRKHGGEQFIEMINGSMVRNRDPKTQQTATALYFYFLPAQENMERFTDKYGRCWVEKPPKGTMNIMGVPITMGSEEYLMAVEEQKKRQSDKALNEQHRTYPRTIEHAMRDEDDSCVFNSTKLYDQLEYNSTIPVESRYMVGNFEWKDQKDGDVEFRPSGNGRFKVSWLPSKVDGTEHLQNRVKTVNGKPVPLNGDVLRFGCDPFSLKATHGEGSKGGLHGKTMMIPTEGAPKNKFVVEYIARPPSDTIFFEDVIKCIKFYGAPILVESNRIDLLRHMRNRGYRNFALNRLDRPANKLNENEIEYGGQTLSSADILDSHMNSIGTWIQNYVGYSSKEEIRPLDEIGDMPFDETLRDWLAFDPSKRTKFDATISSGLAIMATQPQKYKPEPPKRDENRLKGLFPKYSNKGSIGKLIMN